MKKICIILAFVAFGCSHANAQTVEELKSLIEIQGVYIAELERKFSIEQCKNAFNNFNQDLQLTNCELKDFTLTLQDKRQELLISTKAPTSQDKHLFELTKQQYDGLKKKISASTILFEAIKNSLSILKKDYALREDEEDVFIAAENTINACYRSLESSFGVIDAYIEMLEKYYSNF